MTDLQNASSTENFNEVKTTVDTQPKVATEWSLNKFIKSTVSFLAKITGQPDPVTWESNPISQKVPNVDKVFTKVWDSANDVTNKVVDVTNKTIDTATTAVNKTIDTATTVANKASQVAEIVAKDAMFWVNAVSQTISENIPTTTKPETKPEEQTQSLDNLK
jgi:ABC-type transporter Mla subunit MlaD